MPRRVEVLIAILVVVFGAFYTRAEWIPASAEEHVELAGERYDTDFGEPNRWFSAWSIGDGQAFAVIAADPTGMKLSEEIKEPAYRFSRAGYGWLSAVASLGQNAWIPYGLAIVGALAVLGTLLLAIYLRESLGWRSWILILNPAIYIGFAGDTAEPLAVLLLAYAMSTGAVWAAAALGVTRPTFLVAVITKSRLLVFGVLAALALLAYSILQFGTEDLIPDGGRLGMPMAAYFENPSAAGWLLALVAAATLIIGVVKKDWAWVGSGLLVLSLGSDVTRTIENAWRAAGMLPVLWAFGPGFAPMRRVGVEGDATDAAGSEFGATRTR